MTLRIIPFRPDLASHFRELNREWIERLFVLEPADARVLDDPIGTIIERGGAIFFAELDGAIVGTVAAISEGHGHFELSKMAVTPGHQGMGIGRKLGEAAVRFAHAAKAERLFLYTNSSLANAIHLYGELGFVHRPLPNAPGYARGDVYMEWAGIITS